MTHDDRDLAAESAPQGDTDERERMAAGVIERLNAGEHPDDVAEAFATDASGRRWLRRRVLPALDAHAASRLASWLLAWPHDFRADRRDRSTLHVVERLQMNDLVAHALTLAGSNAASIFWSRVAELGGDAVAEIAANVLASADASTRETTLHTMLLDPYGDLRLSGDVERRLLETAIADDDPEVRGLAAELAMETAPDLLLGAPERHERDVSERLRAAYWMAAFAHDLDGAAARASSLVTDETAPLDARRSALVAAGETLRTRDAAPLLAGMVAHPDPVLAGDAANLMWRLHRNPAIAQAAARSPHAPVRAIAERLLHPEMGSPAAGGSRPGDPTRTVDIYEQMLRQLESNSDNRDRSGQE
jgi:hypothetical protein